MRSLPLATAIVFACTSVAFSQVTPNQQGQNSSAKDQGTQNEAQQTARQQVRNDLMQAGYTDIKIMPESFLVRAKDKSGNSVMMVINPDSITAITEVSPRGADHATTGSAPAAGNSNRTPQPGNAPK
jgi:hypothetical protein